MTVEDILKERLEGRTVVLASGSRVLVDTVEVTENFDGADVHIHDGAGACFMLSLHEDFEVQD